MILLFPFNSIDYFFASQFPHVLFPLPYPCNEEARSLSNVSVLFYPASRSLLRGREIWRHIGGAGNCARYISLGLARGVEQQMCVDCQRIHWLSLAQSGFGEPRQDEAKQVWLITVPKPEHPPCPLQAAGAGGGCSASARIDAPSVCWGLCTLIFSLSRRTGGTSRSSLLGRKLAMFFFVLHFTSLFFWLAAKPEAKRWLKCLSRGRGEPSSPHPI